MPLLGRTPCQQPSRQTQADNTNRKTDGHTLYSFLTARTLRPRGFYWQTINLIGFGAQLGVLQFQHTLSGLVRAITNHSRAGTITKCQLYTLAITQLSSTCYWVALRRNQRISTG